MNISNAEKIVMDALWEENPLTAEKVIERVASINNWSDVTVRTLLNRLMKKEAIAAKRVKRKYHYRPLIKIEDFLETESQAFLSRLFDGKFASFVSHFSSDRKLDTQDIAALKKLVKDLEDD